jgi:glycosyltransferase involved in cell wall biosynthesis
MKIANKDKPLRILSVIHSLRTGGAEKVVISHSKNLESKGHCSKICLVVPFNQIDKEIKYTPLLKSKDQRFLPNFGIAYLNLRKVIKDFRPDVIHCHLQTDTSLCSLVKGIPIVRSIQNSRIDDKYETLGTRLLSFLERRSFTKKNMNLVVCNNLVKNLIEKKYKGTVKTNLIRNGVDIKASREELLVSEDRHLEPFNILTIGTLWEGKNKKMAILALNEILKKKINCVLWILGNGDQLQQLKQLSSDLGISDRVKFVTYFEDVMQYLKTGTLYWSTSNSEGFSIANLEAMSMAIPTIVTDIEGNQEMLDPWPECRVPVNDHMKLADISLELLHNENKRKELGQEMQSYVLGNFTSEVMTSNYIQLYKTLV